VRMLSNFETPREKLIHLVLAGQPQLADKLASPDLIQLRQRISMISHLRPFTVEETQRYIEHRLKVAGYSSIVPMFSSAAVRIIAKYTQGIPRNINNVCFNAMAIAFVQKQKTIDERIILEVIDDLDLKTRSNTAALVSVLEVLNPGHAAAGNHNSGITESNVSNATPQTAAVPTQMSSEDRATPIHSDEWIVEFTSSDVASLNRSKQQKKDGAAAVTAPRPVQDAKNVLSPAPGLESTAPARVGVASAAAASDAPVSHASVAVSFGPQVTRRVVGGTRKLPRKGSSWRSVGPQIVLVILLFLTLGWLATQARRRVEVQIAPKVPAGVLFFQPAQRAGNDALSADVLTPAYSGPYSGNFLVGAVS
jgi:hypothetical protein